MSEAADLVEWLLTTAANSDNPKHFAPRLRQAADRLVSQEAEIAKLREALREITRHSFVRLEKEEGRTLDETAAHRLYQEWHSCLNIARLALSENTDDKG